MSSVEKVGSESRGELWNSVEDRVVRQLKTCATHLLKGKGRQDGKTYLAQPLARSPRC